MKKFLVSLTLLGYSVSFAQEIKGLSIGMTKEEVKTLIKFVKLNKDVLLKFWNEGFDIMKDEVDELINNLTKI